MSKRQLTHFTLRAGLLAALSVSPLAGWCAVAGQFQFVAGEVRILGANGQSRPAQKGQDISEGETVVTGANASAQLKMIDGGLLALRPDSQLKMDAYVFKGREDGTEKANMSLVKGGLRAISGLIGKTNKQNYAINTPTATIGIRGTDHEPVVILPPPPGQSAPNPPGTYNKVNVGSTTLTNQAGTAIVNPNQVGFAGAMNLLPSILPRVPDFYRVTPLPSQRQAQNTPASQSGNNASNSGQSNAGSGDSPSTTSSASGSAGGDAMRLTGADNVSTNPANPGNSGNIGNTGNTTASGAATTVVSTPSATLTGQDAQGNTTNFTTLLQETPAGQVVLGGTTPGTTPVATAAGHYDLIFGGTLTDSSLFSLFSSYGKPVSLQMQDGKVTGFSLFEEYYGSYLKYWLTLDGTVAEAQSDSSTGMAWGRWASGQMKSTITYDNQSETFSASPLPAGGLHYIVGAKPAPEHLSHVLTGTYNYTKIGGTNPTDNLGHVGTLTSASLRVNFSNQLVEQAIIGLVMQGDTWNLSATNLPLQGSGQFNACTGCSGGGLSVVKNNVANSGHGWLQGTLTGSNLNGAAIRYQVSDSSTSLVANSVQGVVALGVNGTAPDAATPYRSTGISSGWQLSGDGSGYNSYDPATIETLTGVVYKGTVEGGDAADGTVPRIITNTGGLQEFVGRAEYLASAGGAFVNTGAENSATVRIGTAVNADVGSINIDNMSVTWGRWAGGTVDIYDRSGNNRLGTIDNSDRSLHWLATSVVSGPMVTLPLTGSYTYSLGATGFTSPTDTHSHTGTLTSASVNANFTTMRVQAEVALNINATNVGISAANMVLGTGGGFSTTDRSGVAASVTCNGGSCGSGSTGYINGQLLGQNASGAAIAYGAAIGANTPGFVATPAMVVNGVAVLKR